MVKELLLIGVSEFKGSNGWCSRFCQRYSLTSRRITGSGKALPDNAAEIVWDYIEGINDYIFERGKFN